MTHRNDELLSIGIQHGNGFEPELNLSAIIAMLYFLTSSKNFKKSYVKELTLTGLWNIFSGVLKLLINNGLH